MAKFDTTDLRNQPAYTLTDAARYLKVASTTPGDTTPARDGRERCAPWRSVLGREVKAHGSSKRMMLQCRV